MYVRIIMRSMSSLVILSELLPCMFSFSTFFVNFFIVDVHLAMSMCMDEILVELMAERGGIGDVSAFLRVSNIW